MSAFHRFAQTQHVTPTTTVLKIQRQKKKGEEEEKETFLPLVMVMHPNTKEIYMKTKIQQVKAISTQETYRIISLSRKKEKK